MPLEISMQNDHAWVTGMFGRKNMWVGRENSMISFTNDLKDLRAFDLIPRLLCFPYKKATEKMGLSVMPWKEKWTMVWRWAGPTELLVAP